MAAVVSSRESRAQKGTTIQPTNSTTSLKLNPRRNKQEEKEGTTSTAVFPAIGSLIGPPFLLLRVADSFSYRGIFEARNLPLTPHNLLKFIELHTITMAQGSLKNLKKAPKSAGSQKRKVVRGKTQAKGRKQKSARRTHAVETAKNQTGITKQINKKNEAIVAAKAIASGTNFALKDISERGSKEHHQQLKARDKKQDKSNKLTGRLKEQIKKLQQGTKTR